MSAVFLDGSESDSAAPPDLTQLKSNGQACTSAGECASGFCADTVCCATDCTGVCTSCRVSGREGTCVAVANGDPSPTGHAGCTVDTSNPCGTDGKCDGAGACRKQVLGTVCKAAACNSGTNMITPQSTCDGQGTCQTPGMLSCAPYVCKDATSCWASCTGNAQCSGMNSCVSGSCGLKGNGATCTANGECMSGHCVDTVCCDQACAGTCQYCKLSASLGACSLVPAMQDPRAVCPASGACKPGGCDGTKTACALAPTSMQCRPPSCASNTETLAANCDATGACPSVMTMPCAPYVCGASACKTMCANDGDCQTGFYCSGTSCVAKKALAETCTADDQCLLGHCADGVCCNTACTGQCEACALTGKVGNCSAVTGAPVTPRPACNTDGTVCAGSCNGVTRASCTYPDWSVECRAAFCDKCAYVLSCGLGVALACPASGCGGDGTCHYSTCTCCGKLGCGVIIGGAIGCLSSCSTNSGCACSYTCSGGSCG